MALALKVLPRSDQKSVLLNIINSGNKQHVLICNLDTEKNVSVDNW